MQLNLTDISYVHPDGETLFNKINFSLSKKVTAFVGNNGSGKTTIFKMISGELNPSSGKIIKSGDFYLLPQNLDQYSDYTLSEILGVDKKLDALEKITQGTASEKDFEIFSNSWEIEKELEKVLKKINLDKPDLSRKLKSFSGGEVSKIFFSSLIIKKPDLALLDEPTNNLDSDSRKFLYEFIKSYKGKIFVISHDVELLNLVDEIIEIHNGKLKIYGGNFEFFKTEREREKNRLISEHKKNVLERKNLKIEIQKRNEAGQKSFSQGRKNAVKTGLPKMAADKRKQNAENTIAAKQKVGESKISSFDNKISDLEEKLFKDKIIKIDMAQSGKTVNKLLIQTQNLIPGYETPLWEKGLNIEIFNGDRLFISGSNGSGKTTLIKTLCSLHDKYSGSFKVKTKKVGLLNQNFLHLDENLNLYQTIKNASPAGTEEHEIRIRLGRFLFYGETVFKKVNQLSGGEKIRLSLLKMLISQNPEVLILDEPTNNLDLTGLEQLLQALNSFNGCLIVISHDRYFVKQLNISRKLKISITGDHKFVHLSGDN